MLLLVAAMLASAGCKEAPESEPAAQQTAAAEPSAAESPGEPRPEAVPEGAAPAVAERPVAVADAPPPEPPPEPTRGVFDLYDNRFLAHGVHGGGLVAKLGLPEGARYVRGGLGTSWSLRHEIDGVAVAVPTGRRALLHLPLEAAQADTARALVLRVYNNAPGQELVVALGGEPVGTQRLEAVGWATVRFELAPGAAVAGENELGVAVSQLARLDDVRAGIALAAVAVLPADAAADTALAAPGAHADAATRSIELAHGAGLAWYVMVPPEGRLELEPVGAATCLVEVRADSPQRPEAVVEAALGAGAARTVDLEALAGTVARLSLVAGGECPQVALRGARLAVPGTEPALPQGVAPPRNVVIWLIDTLRADHLQLYNPESDVRTPNLDAFAREHGVVFERVYADGNESKVSHASLFSGLFPIRHRHYRSSTRLADDLELLPEAMQRAGLLTAGFVSNGYISDTWGFEQGWDRFVNTIREGRASDARSLMRIARPWLRKHAKERFFAYFGTIDPHVHYFRHPEFIDLYDPDDAANMKPGKPFVWKASGSQIHAIARGDLVVDDGDKARIKALYKNEITYNDKHFGKMLELLDELGIRDETLVLVVADHGEEFWEHGGVGHARTLYQHTVHVPLIVSYPPLFPPGTRVAEGADLVDIYATLAHHLGVDPAPPLQGEDLAALAHGVGAGYPRPTVSTMGSRRYAMQLADLKLAVDYDGRARVHRIVEDPWEQRDLAADPAHAYEARLLHDAFGTYLAYRSRWEKQRFGVASNLAPGFAEALAQSPK